MLWSHAKKNTVGKSSLIESINYQHLMWWFACRIRYGAKLSNIFVRKRTDYYGSTHNNLFSFLFAFFSPPPLTNSQLLTHSYTHSLTVSPTAYRGPRDSGENSLATSPTKHNNCANNDGRHIKISIYINVKHFLNGVKDDHPTIKACELDGVGAWKLRPYICRYVHIHT